MKINLVEELKGENTIDDAFMILGDVEYEVIPLSSNNSGSNSGILNMFKVLSAKNDYAIVSFRHPSLKETHEGLIMYGSNILYHIIDNTKNTT